MRVRIRPLHFGTVVLTLTMLVSTAASAQPKNETLGVGQAALNYTADEERFSIVVGGGAPVADVSTFSYVRSNVPAVETRPVLFAFNGGPGSSSVYLHVGMLGPRRAVLSPFGKPIDPKAVRLIANEDSPLDVADIVLIDPPGTGASEIRDLSRRGEVESVQGDARIVSETIVAWIRKHKRQNAPIYILGESYGAVRSVEVADHLSKTSEGKQLTGLILLSQSLPIVDTVQRRSNIVGQAVGLPTLAATAWFHERAGQGIGLVDFVKQSETFAGTVYLPALYAGNTLSTGERRRVAEGLSRFSGLPPEEFEKRNLFMTKEEFRLLLLAEQGKVIGRYDTRYVGDPSKGDPSGPLSEQISSAAMAYLREVFPIAAARYRLSAKVAWNYVRDPFAPTNGSDFDQIDYAGHLAKLMDTNVKLKVLVVGGYYDTTASVGVDEFLLSRTDLDKKRLVSQHFVGGHMFYTEDASRREFARTLRSFIQ